MAVHEYVPWGSAIGLFESRDGELVLSGPAGTGKSRACLEKLHTQALLYPGMRGIILRKTAASLGSTALKTWRVDVVKEALATGLVIYYGGSAQEPPQYRYSNGSAIFIGGMDKPSKIMSSEYDVAYVQEATELGIEDWEAIITRLRNGRMAYQQLIADCNPDIPTHWLLARCQRAQAKMIECRHQDNPMLYTKDGALTARGEDYIGKLESLTGVRYQRLRHGLWVAADGLIYEDFEPAIMKVDPFEIPENWARYWSVDFGFTNPFVLQQWAEDPDGVLYLYREIYRTGRTVDQHARSILAVVQPKGPGTPWIEPKPHCIVADHDAESRARFSKELGLGTKPANKKVLYGIQQVQIRMKAKRIFFFKDAVIFRDQTLDDAKKPCSTLEEVPGYVWLPGPAKEQPHKEDDHGMDAMRYLVCERDPSSQPRVRIM